MQLEDKFALNASLAFIIILELNYVTVLVLKVIFQDYFIVLKGHCKIQLMELIIALNVEIIFQIA